MNRTIALFAALIIISAVLPAMSWAGEKKLDIFSDVVGHYPIKNDGPKNWQFDVGLQRFIKSHTTEMIGHNEAPFEKPLSRLVYSLDTWWLDFKLRRTCPRWSAGARAGLSVDRNTYGRMTDSDWEDTTTSNMLTTYAESACRAEQNYRFRGDVDMNIADWLRLPPWLDIRPLFAFEFMRLNLMAHDGMQWTVGAYNDDEERKFLNGNINSTPLQGDIIHFRQDYWMYQIGLRASCEMFRIGKHITIKSRGEADWGPVLGYNEDHHLLRGGDMFAYTKSSGYSLYFLTGLDMVISKTVTAGVTIDYLWIRTKGATKEINIPNHTETEWWSNGVKVWSDQMSLIAHVSYAF